MAQTGYTPIQLYYTTTVGASPTAGNLANGELAINITDGKLFYKDNGGSVQTIAYKNVPLNTVTGTLAVANGGTGQTSYTDGQLLIGNSVGNTLTPATLTAGSGVTITNGNGSISIAATGSGGTVTSVGWTGGIVSIANATTTPAFTIAGTSGGVPYFNSSTTWATSAALTNNAIMLGGGAGAAPKTTTTGTGVVTALGVNTGSAGAFVVNGGALGTPTSGNLSNATADGTNPVGFKNIPYVTDKTSNYSLATGDVGKVIGVGSGGSITIPNSTFAAGDAVLVYNNTAAGITITCNTTSAYIAGTNTTKASVTLATRGVANILFVSSTVAVLTGNVS